MLKTQAVSLTRTFSRDVFPKYNTLAGTQCPSSREENNPNCQLSKAPWCVFAVMKEVEVNDCIDSVDIVTGECQIFVRTVPGNRIEETSAMVKNESKNSTVIH
jgi:hypothetical protein